MKGVGKNAVNRFYYALTLWPLARVTVTEIGINWYKSMVPPTPKHGRYENNLNEKSACDVQHEIFCHTRWMDSRLAQLIYTDPYVAHIDQKGTSHPCQDSQKQNLMHSPEEQRACVRVCARTHTHTHTHSYSHLLALSCYSGVCLSGSLSPLLFPWPFNLTECVCLQNNYRLTDNAVNINANNKSSSGVAASTTNRTYQQCFSI